MRVWNVVRVGWGGEGSLAVRGSGRDVLSRARDRRDVWGLLILRRREAVFAILSSLCRVTLYLHGVVGPHHVLPVAGGAHTVAGYGVAVLGDHVLVEVIRVG